MTLAAKLDAAIKAVCPIHGVSIGRWEDRSTWRIDFKEEATEEQRIAAQDVLSRFDPDATILAKLWGMLRSVVKRPRR